MGWINIRQNYIVRKIEDTLERERGGEKETENDFLHLLSFSDDVEGSKI